MLNSTKKIIFQNAIVQYNGSAFHHVDYPALPCFGFDQKTASSFWAAGQESFMLHYTPIRLSYYCIDQSSCKLIHGSSGDSHSAANLNTLAHISALAVALAAVLPDSHSYRSAKQLRHSAWSAFSVPFSGAGLTALWLFRPWNALGSFDSHLPACGQLLPPVLLIAC